MLFSDEKEHIPLADSSGLTFFSRAFVNEADQWFSHLTDTLNWREDHIQIAGKTLKIPRLQAWYGEKPYQYSGIFLPAQTLPPVLHAIKNRVESLTGHRFNVVLANYYRDGQDSVGWHSDDEPELGLAPIVACVSLGAERSFLLKPIVRQAKTQQLLLPHGSLLVMEAGVQEAWQHAILKESHCKSARLSLTFRYIC